MLKSQADPVEIISTAFGKWYSPASHGKLAVIGEYGQCATGKNTSNIYKANPVIRKAEVSQMLLTDLVGLIKESLNDLPSRL